MENPKHVKGGNKINTELYVQVAIIAVLALMLFYGGGKIYGLSNSQGLSGGVSGIASVSASEIIPTGVPEVYGKDMGVSYDSVSASNPSLADATIAKLSSYEDLTLNEEQLSRYIESVSQISCEYCCGAKSIIFDSGKRACGCAHSYAMRGLAKYLFTEHPEMSNNEILSELGKWKVLFFPGIHEQKAQILESQGIDSTDYINLASNKYRGIEKGQTSSGGMVGGC